MELFNALINYIGGTVRYLLGSVFFFFRGKPNYTFKEYIHGINGSDHFYDTTGHRFVNTVIGLITLVTFVSLTRHFQF